MDILYKQDASMELGVKFICLHLHPNNKRSPKTKKHFLLFKKLFPTFVLRNHFSEMDTNTTTPVFEFIFYRRLLLFVTALPGLWALPRFSFRGNNWVLMTDIKYRSFFEKVINSFTNFKNSFIMKTVHSSQFTVHKQMAKALWKSWFK